MPSTFTVAPNSTPRSPGGEKPWLLVREMSASRMTWHPTDQEIRDLANILNEHIAARQG